MGDIRFDEEIICSICGDEIEIGEISHFLINGNRILCHYCYLKNIYISWEVNNEIQWYIKKA